MGWDSVMPEFNFRQAFITNIFGVWQEHRGVGLPDGMGHTANLVHTTFLWMLFVNTPTKCIAICISISYAFNGDDWDVCTSQTNV